MRAAHCRDPFSYFLALDDRNVFARIQVRVLQVCGMVCGCLGVWVVGGWARSLR